MTPHDRRCAFLRQFIRRAWDGVDSCTPTAIREIDAAITGVFHAT
jgi:hypothetical protein